MTVLMSVVGTLCAEIKDNILTGKYLPGTVLRQEELAKQFDVSRVPLREAFSKLEAEGYLLLRPRRGYSVATLNPEEIAEVFDMRMVIESHAGQIATKNRTDEDVAEVMAIVDQMEAINPSDESFHTDWCDLNRVFHERLERSCGRPRLLQLSQRLRDTVEPYIRLESSMTGYSSEPDHDHREIANAFAEGNVDLVGALIAAHSGRTAARLLRIVKGREKQEKLKAAVPVKAAPKRKIRKQA